MRPDDKRKITSRQNAQKSTGPKTPAGKQASSRNAFKHGCYIQTSIMPGEDQEEFDAFLRDHRDAFKPTNAVEFDLVETIAITKWRLNRIQSAENNLVFLELEKISSEVAKNFDAINPSALWGMGALKLERETQACTIFGRMESRLRRQYQTFVTTLFNLRKNPPTSDVPYDIQPEQPTTQPPTQEPDAPSEPGTDSSPQPQPAAKNGGTKLAMGLWSIPEYENAADIWSTAGFMIRCKHRAYVTLRNDFRKNLILLQPVQSNEPASQPKSTETQPSPHPRVQAAAAGRL